MVGQNFFKVSVGVIVHDRSERPEHLYIILYSLLIKEKCQQFGLF
jgi:hypothetical protein